MLQSIGKHEEMLDTLDGFDTKGFDNVIFKKKLVNEIRD